MLPLLFIGGSLGLVWLLTHRSEEPSTPPSGGFVPTTPAAAQPVQELLAAVPGIIAQERDPARLEQLAAALEQYGQPQTAAIVRRQAAVLRTAASAPATPTTTPTAPAAPDWTMPFPSSTPGTPATPPAVPPLPTTPAAAAQTVLDAIRSVIPGQQPGGGAAESPASPATGGINPARLMLARATAIRVDSNLRGAGRTQSQRRSRYNHDLLKWFQTLAGLGADGRYGGRTRGALRFFGVQNPIPAFESRNASYQPNLATLASAPPEPPAGVSSAGRLLSRAELDELNRVSGGGDELESATAGDDDEAETAALGAAAAAALGGRQGDDELSGPGNDLT